MNRRSIERTSACLIMLATAIFVGVVPSEADVFADESKWTKLIDDALRYQTVGENLNAVASYKEALTEAQRIDDGGPHVIRTLLEFSDLQSDMHDYDGATASLDLAQKLAQSMPGQQGLSWQATVLGGLADFYKTRNATDDSARAAAEKKKIEALIPPDATDFSPGFSRLQYSVRSKWHPPHDQISFLTTVDWQTQKNGHFDLMHLHQSSGNAVVDEAAIAAVRALSDTTPLPPTALGPIDMRMDFAYNAVKKDGTKIPPAYKRAKDSIKNSLKSVDDVEAAAGPNSPTLIALLLSLGHTYEGANRYPDAENAYERALKIYKSNHLSDKVVLSNIYCLLGRNSTEADKLDKADKWFKEALKTTEDTSNPAVANARGQVVAEYRTLLLRTGRRREWKTLR